MALKLNDISITYLYIVLKDAIVMVYGLLFPTDFIILDMPKDFETPLLLGVPFLATCKVLFDVAPRELILRFNDEKVFFNVFEALKHQKENP